MVVLVLFGNGAFAKQSTAPHQKKTLTIFTRKIIKPILTEKRKGSCWKFFGILFFSCCVVLIRYLQRQPTF